MENCFVVTAMIGLVQQGVCRRAAGRPLSYLVGDDAAQKQTVDFGGGFGLGEAASLDLRFVRARTRLSRRSTRLSAP